MQSVLFPASLPGLKSINEDKPIVLLDNSVSHGYGADLHGLMQNIILMKLIFLNLKQTVYFYLIND